MEEPSRYICGEAAIAYIFSANEGQGRGVVLALAAYGASHSEIAAALDVPTSALSEIDRYHMQLGSGAAQGRLLDLLWKKAEGGNASVMTSSTVIIPGCASCRPSCGSKWSFHSPYRSRSQGLT